MITINVQKYLLNAQISYYYDRDLLIGYGNGGRIEVGGGKGKLEMPELLGTLAGDDTCVVIMRDNAAAAEFCAEIREQTES